MPSPRKNRETHPSHLPVGRGGDTASASPKVKHSGELRGAALVIVLTFLIVITGLVVAFLSSVTNDATTTSAAASSITTRSLADAAIQLTIAQIRDATAGYARNTNDGSLDTATPTGWASQPGAIRVFTTKFNGNTANTNIQIYKLYSASSLVDSKGGAPSDDLPARGWWSNGAVYVDLNAPVSNSVLNTNIYPIMDPSMTNFVTGTSPVVDGFSIDTTVPCYYPSNPAAMPVSWLYMLRDGTLIAPDTNSSPNKTTFANAPVRPSSNNPIVGRIAFWSDDETCKLNINTASEGVPWDVPTFNSIEELDFMHYAPGASEFNRFPGHPFSVSLSPVLWSYFGFTNPAQLIWATPPYWSNVVGTNGLFVWNDMPPVPSPLATNYSSATNYLSALFGMSNVVNGILPRTTMVTNGSFFGSFRTIDISNRASFTNIPVRSDRLYASVDEINFLATNSSSVFRANNTQIFSPKTIANLRFFITTESRAPEVNILNLPRICLWPLNDTNAANTNTANMFATNTGTRRWSSLDKMIAQCSTLGTNPYYFTRFDPLDPFNDYTKIPRNQILYAYLAKLLQAPLPGFASTNSTSSSFATRWGTNACFEMSTLCFDYIRSCINLIDSYGSTNGSGGTDTTNPATRYAYSYTAPPTNFATNSLGYNTMLADNSNAVGSNLGKILPPGSGQVVPITISTNITTRGIGRFPVIKSVSLVFCAVAADQPPLMISNTGTTPRVPIVPWQVNPLHPYPSNVASTSFNSNPGLNTPSTFTLNRTSTDPDTGITTTTIRTNLNSFSMAYQYPSAYPTNLGLMNFTAGASGVKVGDSYTNNWAASVTKVYTNYTNGTFYQATNSYQCLTNTGIPGLTNAHALTITHAGLVYGGDLDTNNPSGTNYGFDAYNIYFASNAANGGIASLLGINTTASVSYIRQVISSNDLVTLKATNYTSSISTNISIPNTNSYYFPKPYETVMQPVLLLNQGLPTPGFPPYMPNFKIRVSGLGNLRADGSNCFPPGVCGQLFTNAGNGLGDFGLGYPDVGPDLFGISLYGNAFNNMTNGVVTTNGWPFVGNIVKATNTASPNFGRTFAFGGGTITIDYLKPSASYTTTSSNDIIQSVTIAFPSTTFPTPKLPVFNGAITESYNYAPWYIGFSTNYPGVNNAASTPGNPLNFIHPRYLLPGNSLPPTNNPVAGIMGWFFMPEQGTDIPYNLPLSNSLNFNTATTIRSIEAGYGDWRLPAMMRTIGASTSLTDTPNPSGYGYTPATMTNLYMPHVLYYAGSQETVAGLGAVNPAANTNFFWRSAHSIRGLPSFWLDAHAGNNYNSVPGSFSVSFGNVVTNNNDAGCFYPGMPTPVPNNTAGKLLSHLSQTKKSGAGPNGGAWAEALSTTDFGGYISNNNAANLFSNVWANGGDFDNPAGGCIMSGPYINKADEGTVGWVNMFVVGAWGNGGGYNGPYPVWASLGRARFSPNKQVSSAGILGSLPAGFDPSNPSITNAWQSLVFCPNPNSSNRVAAMANPPDYMIMDLFDMPVVQPYPISDPFSTAGRVNLNFQIAPFSHIHRDSALRGVLKSVQLAAVPDNAIANYKNGYRNMTYMGTNGVTNYYSYYYPIHLNETLRKFDTKFATNGFFRAGAEICSMWLYPALAPNNGTMSNNIISSYQTNPAVPIVSDPTNSLANIRNWWYANPGSTRKGLTGANVRNRPYANLYANITTKSNTYQIHYRVQTLKQTATAHSSDWSAWIDPSAGGITDKVVGESRGSAVIERYIDPSDPNIPDFAKYFATNNVSVDPSMCMDAYYRFRVLNSKQFTP